MARTFVYRATPVERLKNPTFSTTREKMRTFVALCVGTRRRVVCQTEKRKTVNPPPHSCREIDRQKRRLTGAGFVHSIRSRPYRSTGKTRVFPDETSWIFKKSEKFRKKNYIVSREDSTAVGRPKRVIERKNKSDEIYSIHSLIYNGFSFIIYLNAVGFSKIARYTEPNTMPIRFDRNANF